MIVIEDSDWLEGRIGMTLDLNKFHGRATNLTIDKLKEIKAEILNLLESRIYPQEEITRLQKLLIRLDEHIDNLNPSRCRICNHPTWLLDSDAGSEREIQRLCNVCYVGYRWGIVSSIQKNKVILRIYHRYQEGDCGKPINNYYKKGFWKKYDRKRFLRNITKLII